jgi:hypothetical protein
VTNIFRRFGLLLVCIAFAGCSSQASSQAKDSSGVACRIDAKTICQMVRNAPVVETDTGITADNTRREQGDFRTVSEIMEYPLESGNSVAVECFINTHTSSVVYAKASVARPLSATDADFLRAKGACAQ